MSKNVVFEGWLTKSPPSKRIWKTKWRKRWFALRQSGELPGQYFLDYYADWNCRRPKGSINLDFCEQVDAGLHMKRSSHGSLPKLRRSVFTIQTQTRTYHLEADCEAEMEQWVDAICKVCGLRATDESTDGAYQNNLNSNAVNAMRGQNDPNVSNTVINSQNKSNPIYTQTSIATRDNIQNQISTGNNEDQIELSDQYDCADSTGSYIPISECITGVRGSDGQRAFTFDPQNIVISTRTPLERVSDNKSHIYLSQPQIRINNIEFSENESNLSDDECKSLNASQCNIGVSVEKSFTRLSVGDAVVQIGPPVPPRPPKTLAKFKELKLKESFQGPRIQEPIELQDSAAALLLPWTRSPRRMSYGMAPSSPGRSVVSHIAIRKPDEVEETAATFMRRSPHGPAPTSPGKLSLIQTSPRTFDDEEENAMGHSMQYCNMLTLPPAVDRALKPRHSSHSIGHASNASGHSFGIEMKSDTLQYLDLDLAVPKCDRPKSQEEAAKSVPSVHGKSRSSSEARSAYKTVDFLKTEAFNMTRQDAEASRSTQQ